MKKLRIGVEAGTEFFVAKIEEKLTNFPTKIRLNLLWGKINSKEF